MRAEDRFKHRMDALDFVEMWLVACVIAGAVLGWLVLASCEPPAPAELPAAGAAAP